MSGGKQFGKLEQFWGFPAQSIGGCVCAHTYIQTFRVFARSASLSLKVRIHQLYAFNQQFMLFYLIIHIFHICFCTFYTIN